MPGIRRFKKSVTKLDNKKEDVVLEFNGILGVTFKGNKYVEVPNREGYVYVRLRSNLNEVIQAYNSSVSPIYDLPVLVRRDRDYERYIIVGRDLGRYSDWGTSPYLPRHGAQHSFSDENYGGDIVWVYDRQFVPLSIAPSGAYGANNVYVNGDVLYWDGEWAFAGNTGTPDIFAYKPTGTTARMVLVYINSSHNPALVQGDDIFDSTATGLSQIIPYLPTIATTQGIPIGAVRLLSGTSRITWREIYDLRPLLNQANWTSPYQVQDEGSTLPRRSYMNFKGLGVWAQDNAGADATDISISGTAWQGGSGYYGHTIADHEYPKPYRNMLNFAGNLYVQDDPVLGATTVGITGSGLADGHYILSMPTGSGNLDPSDDPEVFYPRNYLDFRGNIVKVTDAEESNYWATEMSISGTQVIQSATDPTGTMTTFAGQLWLKKYT